MGGLGGGTSLPAWLLGVTRLFALPACLLDCLPACLRGAALPGQPWLLLGVLAGCYRLSRLPPVR